MSGFIERFINIFVNSEDATQKLDNLSNNLERTVRNTDSLSQAQTKSTKSIRENGGAMGLLSAATGGLANDFRDAIEAAEGLGLSMKGLRGAIIATGIGALAILVLELVTNWDKWKGVIDGSTAALESLNAQLQISNTRREESNRITAIQIANSENELRLLQAQGAAQELILQRQIEIAKIKETQARADIASYEADLARVEGLIAKDEELLDLRNELFNLQTGQTTRSEEETRALIQAKEEEIATYIAGNENFKTQKDLTDKLTAARIALNTAITDPQVLNAADRQRKINEAAKVELDLLNQRLERAKSYGAEITRISDALSQSAQVLSKELEDSFGQVYTEYSRLESERSKQQAEFDKFVEERRKLQIELREIDKTDWSLLSEADRKRANEIIDRLNELDKVGGKSEVAINKIREINESIVILKGKALALSLDEIESNEKLLSSITKVNALRNEELLLNEQLFDWEFKRSRDVNEGEKSAQMIQRINDLLRVRLGIVQESTQGDIDNQKALVDATRERILQLEEERNNLTDNEENSRKSEELLFKIQALKVELSNQEVSLTQMTQDQQLQIETLYSQARTEQVRMAVDARIAEEERYAGTVQTLYGNVYSFMDQLQNEQIIKSKDLRNVLLVAQKGAQIAEVVINTVRENAKLKQQAGEYAGNAALYTGLSSAFAAVDPIAAASYGAAATQYAIAGSRSLSTIPINWGIAAASIASIAATTLTSWNRSSGGGGSAAGGGGGQAAQFNIVGTSQSNQLAAQIAAQQNQPVNAYVVGADVTTQQALDRNRVTNATFL